MQILAVRIEDPAGLHVRPAADLVSCALSFRCAVTLETPRGSCNCKDMLAVLGLDVCQGDEATITCSGTDEEEAAEALMKLSGLAAERREGCEINGYGQCRLSFLFWRRAFLCLGNRAPASRPCILRHALSGSGHSVVEHDRR
jgi:phosphocarrier protein HPr